MYTTQIEFDVSAKCTQTIEILHPDYTSSDIMRGLKNGTFATTMDYNDDTQYIEDIATDARVAKIVAQEVEFEYE